MVKVRVYELARELELKSKRLVEFLQDLGADVKNHMSTVDDDVATLVREHFASKAEKPKEGKPAATSENKAAVAVKRSPEVTLKVDPKLDEDDSAVKGGRSRPSKQRASSSRRSQGRGRGRGRGPSRKRVPPKPRPTEVEISENITVKELAGRQRQRWQRILDSP